MLARVDEMKEVRGWFRGHYGIGAGEKVAVFVGHDFRRKGLRYAIEAVGRTQDWKLVIAGDADHEGKYSLGLKEKAKADPSIVLTGFITGETLKEIYCNVGLFVLPSYHEGLSIVLLEAMSYGLSCVASDIPANREMPLDNDRYFTPGDVNALTLLINRFIGTPISGAEKVRQIAALRAKFDWDTVAADTSDIYRGVLRG